MCLNKIIQTIIYIFFFMQKLVGFDVLCSYYMQHANQQPQKMKKNILPRLWEIVSELQQK